MQEILDKYWEAVSKKYMFYKKETIKSAVDDFDKIKKENPDFDPDKLAREYAKEHICIDGSEEYKIAYRYDCFKNEIHSLVVGSHNIMDATFRWNPDIDCCAVVQRLIQNKDWNGLNNLIYQLLRIKLIPNNLSNGYDHSFYFHEILLAYLCGERTVFEKINTKKNGLGNNGYRPYVLCNNILIAKHYKDDSKLLTSLEKAEAYAKTKAAKWHIALCNFFVGLGKKDFERINKSLADFCKLSKRLHHDYPLEKELAVMALGLYMVAVEWLGEEEIKLIKMPEERRFCKEYVLWRMENRNPERKLFFRYPEEYGILNVMLETDLPDMILYEKTEYGHTKRYEDHRTRFLLFVEALEKNLRNM